MTAIRAGGQQHQSARIQTIGVFGHDIDPDTAADRHPLGAAEVERAGETAVREVCRQRDRQPQRMIDQGVHHARDLVRQHRISQRRNRKRDSRHQQCGCDSCAQPIKQAISHVGFVEQIAFHFA
jgi:hypothetical protein